MKMVCKKLLSLVLVALMLVTALPFQASAAGSAVEGKYVDVILNEKTSDFDEYQRCTLDGDGKITASDIATIQGKISGKNIVGWSLTAGAASGQKIGDIVFTADNFNGAEAINLYPVFGSAPHEHNFVLDSETPATCTTTGLKTLKCSCGVIQTEVIPMKDHTYGEWVTEKEATCGEPGSRVKTCTICNGAAVRETIPATGNHTWNDGEIVVEATATTEGTKLYTCKVCGETKTENYGANVKEIVFQVTVNGTSTSTKKGFVINKTMELPTPSVPAGYKFKGWFSEANGKGTQLTDGTTCTENLANVYYAYFTEDVKFDYNVYLNIYTDNKVDEPAKRITITNGIAKDGKVTLAEVKDVVFDYYTAKDSNGITFDGLYMATGNWVDKFNKNDKFDTVDTSDLKEQNNVFVNVMITNAKAKSSSSSSSSSSNPKTGDTIYMAVTVMGLSAASLAAVYYISKKRAVR